ncbi:MAG: hypothetical protein ACM31C_20610, partial [Acidobacteriota bacterium]
MERAPVPAARADSHAWTVSALAAPPAPPGHDDWVVTNVAQAVRNTEIPADDTPGPVVDDGTPVEGTAPPVPSGPMPVAENTFVAGEIDVPTPGPQAKPTPVEFTAASKLLGSEPDPDTGSHTPPIERHNRE